MYKLRDVINNIQFSLGNKIRVGEKIG